MGMTRTSTVLGIIAVATLLSACDTSTDSHPAPTSTSASAARLPVYECDEAIIVPPAGYKDGDTVTVTGRGNCQPMEGTVAQGDTMKGPWQITRRSPTPATYNCGTQPSLIIDFDGKPIESQTMSGNIGSAPAYVNGWDCYP